MPASPAGPLRSARLASVAGSSAGALMGVLRLANASGQAKGLVPPSSCAPDAATTVTCMAPAPGITGVIFSTFLSLSALQAAYVARVGSLSAGQLAGSHSGCGRAEPGTGGEAGWSDQSARSASRAAAGTARGPRAAGQVFCTMTAGGQEDMVWTSDDGRLLGWVAGEPHQAVWAWWAATHEQIALPG
jgi:hypothetical protein